MDALPLIEEAATAGTGPISDAMEGLGLPRRVVTGLRLVSDDPHRTIVGPAYTMRQAPKSRAASHDENLTRQRFASSELAQAGDVIVIDVGGRTDVSTWGDNQTMMAQSRGIAGLVVHGAVRDSAAIRDIGLPVLCRAFSPVASRWDLESVAMNEPVVIDGVPIRPGDLVYGDADGLVVIEHERTEEVLTKALDIVRAEAEKRQALHN
jgi:4-hydroxy-4-methyl-2-oxoglutarate aldolase